MTSPRSLPLVAKPAKVRRDYRLPAVMVVVVLIALLGYGVRLLPDRGVETAAQAEPPKAPAANTDFSSLSDPRPETTHELTEYAPREPVTDDKDSAGRSALKKAGAQIKARQFDKAIVTLNEARPLVQKYPESYLLLGRALEGKRDYQAARDFYAAALDRNPYLADAHWGFATASESLGDLESALGGMRSYLHTEPDPDPRRLRINQARSSIWEWEAKLGRGPWGPTKGIPPGFSADELKRDGRGVGVKMPLEHTKQADGTMKYEIKSADKITIYPRP